MPSLPPWASRSCCRRPSPHTRSTRPTPAGLPLAVYLVGAAATVALSFIFVIVRDVRARAAGPDRRRDAAAGLAAVRAPGDRPVRLGLDRRPGHRRRLERRRRATLFLWVYGWVGVAIFCAIIGPVWHFLDPFSTLHDIGAWALRRGCGVQGWAIADYPARARPLAGDRRASLLRLARARRHGGGPRIAVHRPRRLHRVHAGDDGPVRSRRMAPQRRDVHGLVPAARPARAVRARRRRTAGSRRRPFASGLLEPRLATPTDVILVASRDRRRSSSTGCPRRSRGSTSSARRTSPIKTLQLFGFLGDRRGSRRSSPRRSASPAIGAGLLPIAVGYLIAHYFTYLLIDGQRILIAIADPFQQGWDLGLRLGVLRADGGVAAAGLRLDDPARGGRRRPHAGSVGRPRRGGGGRTGGASRHRPSAAAASARGHDGGPDDADAVAPRPGDRRRAAANAEVVAPVTRHSHGRPSVGPAPAQRPTVLKRQHWDDTSTDETRSVIDPRDGALRSHLPASRRHRTAAGAPGLRDPAEAAVIALPRPSTSP